MMVVYISIRYQVSGIEKKEKRKKNKDNDALG